MHRRDVLVEPSCEVAVAVDFLNIAEGEFTGAAPQLTDTQRWRFCSKVTVDIRSGETGSGAELVSREAPGFVCGP